ncbi:M14 family zinc carboxypeptidase [Nocardioides aequoreus]|uniref:M14 family zinc carboxypeptidase n=1 Tax=Nocardioides aequoreus TaxID=397278 RepID=UPI0005697C85|nr:M14 family zinc carboxypeptidase [Nocardioides aequoreus]
MRSSPLLTAAAASLAGALVTTLVGPAAAAPAPSPDSPDTRGSSSDVAATELAELGAQMRDAGIGTLQRSVSPAVSLPAPLAMPTSYPSQPRLRTFPDATPDDAADTGELIAYDEIGRTLTDLMERSRRVSTQVVGRTTGGRDLYLVTVTSPESRAETGRQTAWREKMREEPARAARDAKLRAGYKTPIWISANIHGNEWEGTDAALNYIEDLATAPRSEVGELLDGHRLYFSVALNPDGRTVGTRRTGLALDANRDMITNTTPEATSYVRTAQAIQPMYAADLHGYTDVLQVEPCGPPHGENYEYDLFLPHGYAAALKVEQDVVAADIPGNTYYNVATGDVVEENTSEDTAHIAIPYRDTPSGWDDYPPIFTAQYAAYHGAVTSTVELPLARPNGSSQTPSNAVTNVAVAEQTITSLVEYVADNSEDMLADQIEVFRRGEAGEAKQALTADDIAAVPGPDQWKQHWDVADDQDAVTVPRVYAIPMGARQRSRSDASALVRQLLFHDVEVSRLTRPTRLGTRTYPTGTYVVDMAQPLRGLANTLLDLGGDISEKVPTMYDISAWSYSYLWGATVDKIGRVNARTVPHLRRVSAPTRVGGVARPARNLTFKLAGVADYRALNALLDRGVGVRLLRDGTPVTGRDSETVRSIARAHDVRMVPASARQVRALRAPTTKKLDDLRVAYTGTQDDMLALRELGFDDLVPVDGTAIDDSPAVLNGVDVIWLGSELEFEDDQVVGRRAVASFVQGGGGLVGSGAGAARTMSSLGVVQATPVEGEGNSNGIVRVDAVDNGVLGGRHEQRSAFVYPAVSFVDLGARASIQERYAARGPLLAGHWVGTGEEGEAYAAGKPSVVSGTSASGSRGLVFGTSVFFRTHPKGGLSQGARGIFWAAPPA